MHKINWHSWPQYGQEEWLAVERVIKSNHLFAAKEVKAFEDQFAAYVGCNYALGVGNATQGLHLALAALDIGIGDEVIVTSYSWISTASCILMQNAVPVFCDIEEESLGACPIDIARKITDKTKAIIITHMLGYPAKIKEIVEIGTKNEIPVIEDASHAHGAKVDGKKIGNFGKLSVFSLHQRKSLSVGDGGIVCTSDKIIRDRIFRLRSFGDLELSYNYRMTEFAGALGQIGLRKLDKDNSVRRKNAELLIAGLKDLKCLTVKECRKDAVGVFYAVLIQINSQIESLDYKIEYLQNNNIPIRKTWRPLHLHPHFNPIKSPARGLPWKLKEYTGGMRNIKYQDLVLPNVSSLCPDKVLELYVHPPNGQKEISCAIKHIKYVLS